MIATDAGRPAFEAKPVPRQKRSDLLVEQIKQWIVSHAMQPGDELPREKELIEKLGMSRGTVREALRALEFQGLVEISPGASGGARVASMSLQNASQLLRNYFYFRNPSWAEVYEMREMLEPSVAASAVGRLTAEQFQRLEASIETCARGGTRDSEVRAIRSAELEFHRIIVEACPNPLLRFQCHFINDLLADFAEYRDVIQADGEQFRQENLEAHLELAEALRHEDRAGVESLMRSHIHTAGCFVSEREERVQRSLLL
jgi:DNA-binding FadR family transcriptional regulator